MKFARITVDSNHMDGEPCIRGLPILVATVAELVEDGRTAAEIVALHPSLTVVDVLEALEYQLHCVQAAAAAIELDMASLDDDTPTEVSLATSFRERDVSADDDTD